MIRTVAEWIEILRPLNPTAGAHRMLREMLHYHPGMLANDDAEQLRNAIEAAMKLQQWRAE